MEEFELREKQKMAQLEEEIKRAEQESKLIQKSQEFAEFVDTSSKLVERALNEKYDFMKDYTLGIDIERYGTHIITTDITGQITYLIHSDENFGKHVKFVCEFWDEKWCKNRSVTDVNWSLKVSLVVSYNM
jgi:dynein intermediate chain